MRVMAMLVTLAVVLGACGDDDGEASSGWIEVETDGYVYSVESLGDGFIASEDVDGATRLIVSDDGLTWEAVDTDVVAPGESMYWMDGGPDGAVGEVFEEGLPQVITTADGSTFARADPLGDLGFAEVGIPGMAWGPTGPMVAISRGTEPIGLVACVDGATWASIDLPDGIIDFVTDGSPLAATESGYLFVGVPDAEGGIAGSAGNPGIQAWSSTDGATWVPEEISPDFVAGISSPVPWRHGYAASGSTFAPDDEFGDEGTWETLMWRSTGDGVWSTFEAAGYEGPNEVILVDGSDLGVFAVAWADESFSRLDALFSEDLETWQVWSHDEAFGTSQDIDWGGAAVGSSAVVVPVDGDLRVYGASEVSDVGTESTTTQPATEEDAITPPEIATTESATGETTCETLVDEYMVSVAAVMTAIGAAGFDELDIEGPPPWAGAVEAQFAAWQELAEQSDDAGCSRELVEQLICDRQPDLAPVGDAALDFLDHSLPCGVEGTVGKEEADAYLARLHERSDHEYEPER